MPRETIIVIGAGLVSALLSIAATFGSGLGLLLAYFALLPIIVIGLSRGHRTATFATLSGMFGAILLSNIYQGMLYCISIALPAWLIVFTALIPQTTNNTSSQLIPIGEIISRLAVLGGIFVVISSIIFFDKPGDLPHTIEVFLNKLIAHNRPNLNITTNHRLLVEQMVPLFPAIAVSSWLLMSVINTVVAQAILIKADLNLIPAFQYSKITAPEWLYWALVSSGVIVLTGSGTFEYVGRNLAIIFLIPFLFTGLGVIHTAARQFRSPVIALIIFYFFTIILSWPAFIAILLGFFERWTNFRQKFLPTIPKDKSKLE